MKTAPADVISASGLLMPDWNRITKTSAVLRKLSLNAAKNWHQKSGANFLDSNKGAGMLSYYCKVPGAPPGTMQKNAALRPRNETRRPLIKDGHSPHRIPGPSPQERSKMQSR